MSQEINNREHRKRVLSELIAKLHDGQTVEDVKAEFEATFGGVSAEEIAAAEQSLIEGGLPVGEVQRLCDVHAAVFKGSIEQIHAPTDPSAMPGHPADTLKRENRAIEAVLDTLNALAGLPLNADSRARLREAFTRLGEIDRHYLIKENLMFPYMERYGITAPPKVMWGVDDEIRAQLKETAAMAEAADADALRRAVEALTGKVEEMIFKEENIMLPMLLGALTPADWQRIAEEARGLGHCLIDPPPVWRAPEALAPEAAQPEAYPVPDGDVHLPTGVLRMVELTRMLDALPLDITFVDKDDTVRYFSQGSERVFPRTKAVIGRKVINCHPPASVHIVEKIIDDLRHGRKDHEDFWIRMGEKLILIRYYAVRSEAGEYLGVLEVTQDIAPLQALTGEKRLVTG